jgi:predicted Rossmann fold flavoprotein
MNTLAASASNTAVDVAVIGAGAAGLAATIFVRRDRPAARVVLLDGAARPGAKILVSGGSRCNVTNAVVTERDFNGGSPTFVRRVLRAFPVGETIRFFRDLGVALNEEPGGKLFPVTNRSRDVLDALLRGVDQAGAELHAARRVTRLARAGNRFTLSTDGTTYDARTVVVATGGLSLPKTGSDGAGYAFARAFGHDIVPTTPALVPLLIAEPQLAVARSLAGVALEAELSAWDDGALAARVSGSLLWTHFGVSGPATLDVSRHWLRIALAGRAPGLSANFCPGRDFSGLERDWVSLAAERPRTQVDTALSTFVPASMAAAVADAAGLERGRTLAALTRDERRRVVHALNGWPLAVTGSRGYNYAEVTAGGVSLGGVDASTLQSRTCPGLFFAGEILDVDGRIGGFNFQWAWSTARVAARAVARWLAEAD